MLTDRIKLALGDKHPSADLTRYFSVLESATGSANAHHIAAREAACERASKEKRYCKKCGGLLDIFTVGCSVCIQRKYDRQIVLKSLDS